MSTQRVLEILDDFNQRRFDRYAAAYAPEGTITYPQSGERFVGRDTIRAFLDAFASPPTFTVRSVHDAGDVVVAEVDVDYGIGEIWKGVLLYGFREGLVVEETAYFASPFPPADWRAPFTS